MTNNQHGQVPAIQRYKIGYHSDEWGQRSSTPSGIPDASGSWVRYEDHAAVITALRTTHVQNPAEIEHVAGDVSKNGAEVNTPQQPAPAAQKLKEQICISDTNQSAACAAGSVGTTSDAQTTRSTHDAQATQQAGVALSDDLRDRLVAISEAVADQDDRAAQAMLREILKAPQPSPTAQAADSVTAPAGPSKSLPYEPTSAMLIAARERDPALPIETVRAIYWSMWRTAPTPPAQAADSVLEDAARWQWLADYLIGERTDLDEGIVACATIDDLRQFADAARKQGANHD